MDQEKKQGRFELSRRDFLKVSAAGAAAATALDWAPAPAMASISTVGGETTTNYASTCPYCSAQCGQVVTVGDVTGKVYDVFGDVESPTNNGGLCAKGAGSFQLVNNDRRLGAFAGPHPEDAYMASGTFGYDATWNAANGGADGIAYMRTGNGKWSKVPLGTALSDIAATLVAKRNAGTSSRDGGATADAGTWETAAVPGKNATAVQFYGSSHINNEQNYLYRKLIANFGTSRVEHQARI